MQKALFPGTFDPPTLGHIEIIKRAAKLFDHLIVGIGYNPNKKQPLLKVEQKIETLKKALDGFSNVEVVEFSGLVVDFAKQTGAQVLIRGLRSQKDLDTEIEMANANRELSGIETLLMVADPRFAAISSTLIRELSQYGVPLNAYIPEELSKILQHQKEI